MRQGLLAAVTALVFLPLASAAAEHRIAERVASDSDKAAVVKGDNSFAFDLYGKLRAQKGTIFFSPLSVSSALAMAQAGAGGETAAEMARVLHTALPADRMQLARTAFTNELQFNAKNDGATVLAANGLWMQKGAEFKPAFLKFAQGYGAKAEALDFKHDPEGARQHINDWVMQQTNGKIRDLVNAKMVNEDPLLMLTDAIYFNAGWMFPFDASLTAPRSFHVTKDKAVNVQMMHQDRELSYLDGESFQAVNLPYHGGLAMAVFLPNEVDGMEDFEHALGAPKLGKWLAALAAPASPKEVTLDFPKLKIENRFNFAELLSDLGMRRAFSAATADFSGISSTPAFLSAVAHKSYIAIDEKGTEAAAATVVGMMPTSISERKEEPVMMNVDHPYFFVIWDMRSKAVLFIGRIEDPS